MLVFLVWNWISFAFLSRLYILYFFSLFVIYTMYGIGFCVFIRWSGTQMNLICRPKCGESLCFDHPLIIHIVVSANSQNAGLPLLHKKKNTCTYIIWFGDERAQIAVFHERQQYMRLHLVINHNSDQPHYVSVIEIFHQHGFHQKLNQIPHVVAMCCTQIQATFIHPGPRINRAISIHLINSRLLKFVTVTSANRTLVPYTAFADRSGKFWLFSHFYSAHAVTRHFGPL